MLVQVEVWRERKSSYNDWVSTEAELTRDDSYQLPPPMMWDVLWDDTIDELMQKELMKQETTKWSNS